MACWWRPTFTACRGGEGQGRGPVQGHDRPGYGACVAACSTPSTAVSSTTRSTKRGAREAVPATDLNQVSQAARVRHWGDATCSATDVHVGSGRTSGLCRSCAGAARRTSRRTLGATTATTPRTLGGGQWVLDRNDAVQRADRGRDGKRGRHAPRPRPPTRRASTATASTSSASRGTGAAARAPWQGQGRSLCPPSSRQPQQSSPLPLPQPKPAAAAPAQCHWDFGVGKIWASGISSRRWRANARQVARVPARGGPGGSTRNRVASSSATAHCSRCGPPRPAASSPAPVCPSPLPCWTAALALRLRRGRSHRRSNARQQATRRADWAGRHGRAVS